MAYLSSFYGTAETASLMFLPPNFLSTICSRLSDQPIMHEQTGQFALHFAKIFSVARSPFLMNSVRRKGNGIIRALLKQCREKFYDQRKNPRDRTHRLIAGIDRRGGCHRGRVHSRPQASASPRF